MTNKIGYEFFLPAVSASIASKQKNDRQLNEGELKAVVAVTFRDAVVEFTRDSLLYRRSIPIDLYQDVKRYDLIPPNGYMVVDVVEFQENKVKIPFNTYDTKSIYLNCCPDKDIDQAFYVVLALVPKRGTNCKFDEEFIEEYYDVILANMMYRLMNMENREWRSLGAAREYRREYVVKMNQSKRRALNGGAVIKMKNRRLSEYDPVC